MSVTLYSAKRDSVVAVAHATTNRWGRFQMKYQRPTRLGVYYLLARGKEGTGPGRALTLMTVLGTRERVPVRKTIAINELTTVAAVYSLNQFLHGSKVYGPRPGLTNAAGLVENLADLSVGAYGETVLNAPNGLDNATLATLGTLSNLLATCARGTPANCAALFAAATPAGGRTPTDTLAAIHDIAQNPTHNVVPLFNLAGTLGRPVATPEELQQVLIDELLDSPLIVPKLPGRRGGRPPISPSGLAPYRPALTTPPQAFFLALAYAAPGIDSIGNFGIDALGHVWMSNNMQPPGSDEGHVLPVIDTNGDPVLRSPYRGGGLNLPAFGIAIAPDNHVWVTSVGKLLYGATVSEFSPVGRPLSPITGYRQGRLRAPQGPAFDQRGNLWIPNWLGKHVTEYRNGNPHRARVISAGGIDRPFAVAVDARGRVWVNNSSSVTVLTPSGRPTLHSPITAPWLQQNRTFIGGGKDIAVDSKGNAWATHSRSGTVTEITRAGSIAPHSPIRVPGFFFPWGISVDGNDNVWVINALGNLVHICGERPATCPRNDNGQPRQTGDLISPPGSNYITDSFETLTGVEIDPSGNVWVANNYKKNSAAPHPVKIPLGSNTAVILIGMAAPVKTPMIGPPRRPR